ncbi:urease accessory protein UreD [Corynebacteriaceae bacterium 6-324]
MQTTTAKNPSSLILRGELELRIVTDGGRPVSRPQSQFHRGALSIMRPLYLDESGQVTLFILNPGGGYISGDDYLIEVSVEKSAALALTTQSATKVYRTTGLPARQRMEVSLHEGAVLEYLPDQLIMYRQGSYEQYTDVHMHPNAHLFMAEVVTPGWSPDAQPFQYQDLRMRTMVKVEDESSLQRPLRIDYLRISPSEDDLGVGVMEGYSHCGQLLVVDRGLNDDLVSEIKALVAAAPVHAGVSVSGADFTCPDGQPAPKNLVVRSLSRDTQSLNDLHHRIANAVRSRLFARPPLNLRKY